MKFANEFKYAFLFLIMIFFVYILFSFTHNVKLELMMSLFSIILGSVLIVLGFWGADFAFGVALGHIRQGNERGRMRGKKNMVYVPFMKNYTPLEWWNLNWFIVIIGAVFLATGMFMIGLIAGVYCHYFGMCEATLSPLI